MPILERSRTPYRKLRLIRPIGVFVTAAVLSVACSPGESAVDDGVPVAAPEYSDVSVTWWFDSPCDLEDVCLPPAPSERPTADISVASADDLLDALAGAPPGAVIELPAGELPPLTVSRPDITLLGPSSCCAVLPSLRLEARGVRVIGLVINTVVIAPAADQSELVANRLEKVFLNGADGVALRGNVIRPNLPGPDGVQIKTFDGDTPEKVLLEANIIGPQPSDGERHTDCVQVLGGDEIVLSRNIIMPCGDKAIQIRSGAGGTVGSVTLEANFLMECRPQRAGCEGFHAIVWASTAESTLTLTHNTIRGSVGISTSGSTVDPGLNLVAVGNIAGSIPCTAATVENWTLAETPCGADELHDAFPLFRNDSEDIGDLRPLDLASLPVASMSFGPGISGGSPCAAPRFGADLGCDPIPGG